MPVSDTHTERKWVISAIFLTFIVVFIIRLFYIQVWDDKYQLSADSNSQRHVTQYPARGLVFDRHGKLLVQNKAAYDLMIVPRQLKAFDTLAFCQLLHISIEDVRKKIKKARRYSTYKPSIFLKQVSLEDYASFQEHMFKFSGFFVQTRTLRDYPEPIAAHVLGYVGEVSDKMVKKDHYYHSGDYIGISGIEKQYEKVLRGTKGNKILLVDVHNRPKGKYKNGAFDKESVPGQNITTTLDLDLQLYGEQLMTYKTGSIVAIEPKTGEILSLISAPAYNPNELVGRERSKNYLRLKRDSLKPLFNRALKAQYPPGSIFKIVNALIGLQGGFVKINSHFDCNKSLLGCHNHPPNNTIKRAIQFSCNPYFYQVYKRIIQQGTVENRYLDSRFGLDYWRAGVLSFGMGKRLMVDLPNVGAGNIPNIKFYDKWYGKDAWKFSNIYSNAIGQGELMVVPIQMANLAATIANFGYYYTPHILKAIDDKPVDDKVLITKQTTQIDSVWYVPIQEAMYDVVNAVHGTAGRARIDSIAVCGKTGTVENPHGEDHSVFIAFAPKDDPEIAIAVYIENSGFGGTWAAPIASLMIEKYLNGNISERNKRYKQKRILDYQPLLEKS